MKAAIYTRISDDRDGTAAGVKRQEEDCRKISDDRGWKVIGVYTDNDISAYRGKRRPEYQRLLSDMKNGVVDAVVAWHADRLHRHPTELEEFIEVAVTAGTQLATVTGDLDLGTEDGQFTARILGAVARKESDAKSRRIRRKHEELARQGQPSGGGTRPFGYNDDRVTIKKAEAKLIREAAKRLLAGEATRSIVRDWHQRGISAVKGGSWKPTPFTRMMKSARIAGFREYDGELIEGIWPGIIDRDTHLALRRLFAKPDRRGGRGRRYLLTGGIAVCGYDDCQAALTARPRGDRTPYYNCASSIQPDNKGCGRIGAVAEPLEDFIRDAIFTRLDSHALTAALHAAHSDDDTSQEDLWASIAADEATLEMLAKDHYVDHLISRAEFLAARGPLEERISAAKADLSHDSSTRVLADVGSSREELETWWEAHDVSLRKALVAAVVEKVIIKPAVRGRNYFDADRVEIVWRA